ncbi:hypothetical protein J6590_097740, partial [Homalodisca vitripennis]
TNSGLYGYNSPSHFSCWETVDSNVYQPKVFPTNDFQRSATSHAIKAEICRHFLTSKPFIELL